MSELTQGYTQTRIFMDTVVSIELSALGGREEGELRQLTDLAFAWFDEVERRCSRFDESSELRCLSRSVGRRVAVSPLLFSALELSLAVARRTGGAFDPSIGTTMEELGFATNYKTGDRVEVFDRSEAPGTYRDIALDMDERTVMLRRPVSIDLGAVAKGLAVDLAGQELSDLPGFAINAGGDILARGCNADGEPWRIGVRHPRRPSELLTCLRVSDAAVCTSGDYERRQVVGTGHHVVDPCSGESADLAISATVIAPTAAAADALSTAVFVLGPDSGVDLLEAEGVDGVIVRPDLSVAMTAGMARYISR